MRHSLLLPLALGLSTGACSNSPPPKPAPIADLVVDANRSGLLEAGDPTEDSGEDVWDATHGAVFLANLDDDDQDGKADIEDDVVNGPADLLDLSPITLQPWADAPKGALGTVSMDELSAKNVRLFRVTGPANDPASYVKVSDPTTIPLTENELRTGAQFAIEALDFVSSTKPDAWTGMVKIIVTVAHPMTGVLATDAVKLRVAPLLLQFNTAPTERVFYTDAGQDTQSLADGIAPGAAQAMVEVVPIDLATHDLDVDVWAQDFFDVGWTGKPGPNGTVVGMKIAVRSAQPERSAGAITRRGFRGPDFGYVFKYDKNATETSQDGSMNSFGNWDVIPPYSKGDEHYPLGRNLWGSNGKSSGSPDPVFADFVRAQRVQPEINVDTSWLAVGHVDEFTSWVKTNTPRGWGMLVAWPSSARDMLTGMQSGGSGQVKLFDTKFYYDWQSGRPMPAARAIDQVLSDANLMAANQSVQIRIDENLAKLKQEIGLDNSEVTIMPFLYERTWGAAAAYQPGTVNLLHFDGKVVVPDPFGPIIDGADPFKADIVKRLSALGLDVYFADDWDTFHLGGGEVHCGSNVSRDLKLAWWETGR